MIAEGGGAPITLLASVEGEPGESDVTWAFEVAEAPSMAIASSRWNSTE